MNDTNFISTIVKILETPKQKTICKNIQIISFRVQLPQVRKNSIIFLKIWRLFSDSDFSYDKYKINDYILIEGYFSKISKKNQNLKLQRKEKIQIIVLKVSPFFFSNF